MARWLTDKEIKNMWHGIMDRCYNNSAYSFPRYGSLGIKVCDAWKEFDNFCCDIKSLGPRPDGYSLDRRDPYGNYCPENVRWASRKTQTRNRRNKNKFNKFPIYPQVPVADPHTIDAELYSLLGKCM